MDTFLSMAIRIIKEQELIIGPVAWDEAKKVKGIEFTSNQKNLKLSGDGEFVINGLVKQYSRLFGRASEEVCKEAVKDLLADLPANKVPASLR